MPGVGEGIDMSRKPADRQPLIDWIASQPLGVTAAQVKAHTGWRDGGHTFTVMASLRKQGLIVQHGRTQLARWCTPDNLMGVMHWHKIKCEETAERGRRRKRKNKDFTPKTVDTDWQPRQVIVPACEFQALPVGPRWIFDLGARA